MIFYDIHSAYNNTTMPGNQRTVSSNIWYQQGMHNNISKSREGLIEEKVENLWSSESEQQQQCKR